MNIEKNVEHTTKRNNKKNVPAITLDDCKCQFNDECQKSEYECTERTAYIQFSLYVNFH